MVDVSAYIRELLFRHDCVIVPGFGAFIGNYAGARIDREEGLFYPPSRRITFNRHLTNNDGLLIGHLSLRTGLGYGESRDLVTAFTEGIRGRLEAGSKVMIYQIGTFSVNREGTLLFEPDNDANFLLTSFGLESYHRQPVKDFDVRKKVLEQHSRPVVAQPSIRRMMTRAAVIIPLLVAMALVPFHKNIFKGRMAESSLNPLATAELEYNRSQITSVTPVPVNNDSAIVMIPETRAIIVEEETRFMLVTGSFRSEANALTMIESLRDKGYDPEVSGGPDGFLRVSAATLPTQEEAENALRKIRAAYPGAWVCKTTR